MPDYLAESKKSVNTPAVDPSQAGGYTSDVETLADRIRHLLKIRGVDQRTLAKRAGLSSSYVSVFLSHARENPQAGMSADRLYALAETWGADPQWLLQGKGPPPSETFAPVAPRAPKAKVRFERDPVPPSTRLGADEGHPLQKALGEAFNAERHTVADLRRVDDLMGGYDMELDEVDLVAAAGRWLDAAAALRREGVPFSPQAMMFRLAVGSTAPAAVAASEARAKEQLGALDALAPRTPMEGADDESPGAPAGADTRPRRGRKAGS